MEKNKGIGQGYRYRQAGAHQNGIRQLAGVSEG